MDKQVQFIKQLEAATAKLNARQQAEAFVIVNTGRCKIRFQVTGRVYIEVQNGTFIVDAPNMHTVDVKSTLVEVEEDTQNRSVFAWFECRFEDGTEVIIARR